MGGECKRLSVIVSYDIKSEQYEIIQEFIQETREMVEQLEPAVIELGQSCGHVNCWETMECGNDICVRYGKEIEFPCWLHVGYVESALGSCIGGATRQDCLNCKVFQLINGDSQTLNAIFRLFHSMKGSAGFLELENICGVAHAAENLLDLVRSGGIWIRPQHVDLLCTTCDFTKDALDYLQDNLSDKGMAEDARLVRDNLTEAIKQANDALDAGRKTYLTKDGAKEPEEERTADSMQENTSSEKEFLITTQMVEHFVQEADELLQAFEQGLLKWINSIDDMEILGDLLRNIHSFKGNCGFFGYVDLEMLSNKIETIMDAVKEKANVDKHKAAKVMLELVDVLRTAMFDISNEGAGAISNLPLYLELIESLLPKGWLVTPGKEKGSLFLGDLLIEQGSVSPKEIQIALEEQRKPLGDILVKKGVVTKRQVQEALKKQKEARSMMTVAPVIEKKVKVAPKDVLKRQDIRVNLTKLDSLINLIGELVIAEKVVVNNNDLHDLQLDNFNKAAQQMDKIVRELQEMAMVIRMIPVSGLFRRMIRLVHDLGAKSKKRVVLKLSGEETEVDKSVIETITDPLVHLIRNSIDHGIEPQKERRKAGKPDEGTVRLTARHEEGEVWIIIEDDGKGLDRQKIIEKAISKGLIEGDGSELSDKQVFSLVFQPGFSTADKVTDISGRGVGMDVVKQNLKKIQGKIDIQSRQGVGTKVTLRIPLTLAIIEGMLVRVGKSKCILPILSIQETFRQDSNKIIVSPDGQEIVRLREEFIPILRLHEVLRTEPDYHKFKDGILIVFEAHEKKACLFVDEILGQQQTVIKGLSSYIGNVKGVSGCTILGNGEVSLILDAGTLVYLAEKQEDNNRTVMKGGE